MIQGRCLSTLLLLAKRQKQGGAGLAGLVLPARPASTRLGGVDQGSLAFARHLGMLPPHPSLAKLGQQKTNPDIASRGIATAAQDQYSLIALFSILGGSLLMSSLDLLSMYLSIELQSFALYILATLNKDKLSSTSAGLKYFLLGSLSSCFILLGSAIIYSYTGLTQFEAINALISCLGAKGFPAVGINSNPQESFALLELHTLPSDNPT